jgi:hypothetical protein
MGALIMALLIASLIAEAPYCFDMGLLGHLSTEMLGA